MGVGRVSGVGRGMMQPRARVCKRLDLGWILASGKMPVLEAVCPSLCPCPGCYQPMSGMKESERGKEKVGWVDFPL